MDKSIIPFKWYKAADILPETSDLEKKDEFGVDGEFLICLKNRDMYAAWRVGGPMKGNWRWDMDSDELDYSIKEDQIEFWMKIVAPE